MKSNGWLALGIVGLAGVLGCSNQNNGPRHDTAVVASIRESFGSAAATDESADSAASAAQPTGFATLRGTFRIDGEPPTLPALAISKDEHICAPGGKTVLSQDVVVDPASKGIANILLFAENVPAEWVHESAKGSEDEILFDQKECVFLTHVVAMQTTQKLRALNSDPVGHNLMVSSFNQTIPSGGYAIYEPSKELRAPVAMRCAIHPWMAAWFINRDNGYFAVTKPDGSFEIPNLPAGVPLEFKVWQEKAQWLKDVTVGGQAATWPKGKLTITLQPDQETNLEVVVSAAAFQ